MWAPAGSSGRKKLPFWNRGDDATDEEMNEGGNWNCAAFVVLLLFSWEEEELFLVICVRLEWFQG